jgi:hypothetical protein
MVFLEFIDYQTYGLRGYSAISKLDHVLSTLRSVVSRCLVQDATVHRFCQTEELRPWVFS